MAGRRGFEPEPATGISPLLFCGASTRAPEPISISGHFAPAVLALQRLAEGRPGLKEGFDHHIIGGS
jgi:hypothetical protein